MVASSSLKLGSHWNLQIEEYWLDFVQIILPFSNEFGRRFEHCTPKMERKLDYFLKKGVQKRNLIKKKFFEIKKKLAGYRIRTCACRAHCISSATP